MVGLCGVDEDDFISNDNGWKRSGSDAGEKEHESSTAIHDYDTGVVLLEEVRGVPLLLLLRSVLCAFNYNVVWRKDSELKQRFSRNFLRCI